MRLAGHGVPRHDGEDGLTNLIELMAGLFFNFGPIFDMLFAMFLFAFPKCKKMYDTKISNQKARVLGHGTNPPHKTRQRLVGRKYVGSAQVQDLPHFQLHVGHPRPDH